MGSFHARTLAAMPGVEIVAIADVRLAAAQSLCDEVGGKATTDGLAVASLGAIDGLVIASPEDSTSHSCTPRSPSALRFLA